MRKYILWTNLLAIIVSLILSAMVVFMLHEITLAGNIALVASVTIIFFSGLNIGIYFLMREFTNEVDKH